LANSADAHRGRLPEESGIGRHSLIALTFDLRRGPIPSGHAGHLVAKACLPWLGWSLRQKAAKTPKNASQAVGRCDIALPGRHSYRIMVVENRQSTHRLAHAVPAGKAQPIKI
jgi:hypothetical protein